MINNVCFKWIKILFYNFVNENNLNYVGEVPSYNFFDPKKVSIEDYNKYVESFNGRKWNLKTETLNYCCKDCISFMLKFYIFSTSSVDFSNFIQKIITSFLLY